MFDYLYPAARLGVFKCLLKEEVPVWYATKQLANVYEIEMVRWEGPIERDIVNLKVAVGRHPLGLNGRQIGARDCRRGILVSHVLRESAVVPADSSTEW